MALRRLECLERRMNRDPTLKENLTRQIDEYQQKGYAHRATEEELSAADMKRIWYLPLGAVVNPKKPGKIRLIWDASAMVNGISLNSLLLKGPDQLTSLSAILVRFRQFGIAVSADIKEMFHQIRIREADRHSQRFLWRTDPSNEPNIFLMDVATFGSTCSPASAQYVKNQNATEFSEEYPRASADIIENHYVDDYLTSFASEEEAIEVSSQVREIHDRGGFSLRNWQSNSPAVVHSLGETKDSSNKHMFLDKSSQYERVLGMLWLTDEDKLGFCTQMKDDVQQIIEGISRPTKRQVLRCLMSFFDPLGLLSFLLVHGKILLQDIWRAGIMWDQEIDGDQQESWQRWTEALKQIQTVKIPRCYFPNATSEHYRRLQLHIFVDASEVAYAAVAYFRIVDPKGAIRCILVAAKTKVAPLKPMSIPRLELQAAVLGSRLLRFAQESHNVTVTQRFLWSDSSTVLAWLKSDPRKYKQYVACRIGEILEVTEVSEWQWIPSKQNPADLATKWGNGPSMDAEGVWFTGPPFLLQPELEWPKHNKLFQQTTEEELRVCNVHCEAVKMSSVIDWERFSKWERLHRAMAYVHRYINNLERRCHGGRTANGHLTQAELRQAETTLIKMAQREEFQAEMAILIRNRDRSTAEQLNLDKSSILYHLSPFIDELGILRQEGRIGAAQYASIEMKYPAILPRNHRITMLILDCYHRQYQHGNAETVVNEIRQRYHVARLRALVRKISSSCLACRVMKAAPRVPRMAALPPARLAAFVRPFTYVGLDFFGPIHVKVGRGSAKRWIALFTCLTIRAVHCEVVCSLSTDACIKSIRRFVSRRGAPAELFSDNGSNFQGTARVLMAQIQQGLAATVTSTTTRWVFIPPASPHMGGAWERMVRSVKQAMFSAYHSDRKLDDESLLTFVAEAEAIVNSRPLTYLPLDSEESEALTPNHFLLGSSRGILQPVAEPTDCSAAVRSSFSMIQHQLDCFWRRWIREMLPTLTKRTKWFQEERPITVGDLVLIVDAGKRNDRTRGRILEVIPGSDGRIRQPVVRTAGGLLRRSVAKLAVLNIEHSGKTGTGGQCYGGEDVAAGSTASDTHTAGPARPKRNVIPTDPSTVNEEE
ncbi:uncharacterized protein LOC134290365 [Aedes albopictus]|uniref:Integrase catalytic domain-containing protein n=1 Tax=Aedes albopictus TaxID=7160 RepID=A0ABM1ZY00_AEDAL